MPEPKLTKSAKALLEYFRTFPAGEPITATQSELATALNCTRRSILRAVSQLEESGYIRIESGKEDCKANTYFLNLRTLSENCAPETNVLLENCAPPATFVSKDFTPKANAVLKSFTPPAAEPEKPPVKHEIISVSATVPEFIHYPVDKVNQNLFRYLENGTYSMNVEKAGSSDNLETIVTLDFEELEQNPVLTFRRLTPFDKRVYVAAGALQQAKNEYISATQIYKQMGGKRKSNPTAKDVEKIVESCTKMMGIRLSIDNQEEAAKYPKYKEFRRGLFYLFPVEIVENVSINGRTTDFCLHFLKDELPLFTFARLRKQITEYTPEQWSLPFSMTDGHILLDEYFRNRTARMRRDKARSKNHSYNGKMLYSTIYENCGIDNKVKRTRAIEKIRKLLNHYKATGIIIDYQEGKDGIRITV